MGKRNGCSKLLTLAMHKMVKCIFRGRTISVYSDTFLIIKCSKIVLLVNEIVECRLSQREKRTTYYVENIPIYICHVRRLNEIVVSFCTNGK